MVSVGERVNRNSERVIDHLQTFPVTQVLTLKVKPFSCLHGLYTRTSRTWYGSLDVLRMKTNYRPSSFNILEVTHEDGRLILCHRFLGTKDWGSDLSQVLYLYWNYYECFYDGTPFIPFFLDCDLRGQSWVLNRDESEFSTIPPLSKKEKLLLSLRFLFTSLNRYDWVDDPIVRMRLIDEASIIDGGSITRGTPIPLCRYKVTGVTTRGVRVWG